MNGDQSKKNSLVETTDCLEAVGVFRGWKNSLFVIVLLCLLLLQASFWAVDTGYVKADGEAEGEAPAVVTEDEGQTNKIEAADVNDANEVVEAAKQASTEPNQPAEATTKKRLPSLPRIEVETLGWAIRFVDYVLILVAVLYCLTILFSLKVSLVGRLGGVSHIGRAFFLSLAFLVLLLPWQRFFGGVVAGAIYTPAELLRRCAAAEEYSTFRTVLHYLRFSGYWALVVLLLILAQLRSGRWTKSILRRLEVI